MSRMHCNESTPLALHTTHGLNISILRNVDKSLTVFRCSRVECLMVLNSFEDFKRHLKRHLSKRKEIVCPFQACPYKFTVKSSFSAHLSRKHHGINFPSLSPVHMQDVTACYGEASSTNTAHSDEEIDINNIEHVERENIETVEANDNQMIFENLNDDDFEIGDETDSLFLKNLALFYLKLQGKYLLPSSTIQAIVSEFEECHEMSQNILIKTVCEKMVLYGISPELISSVKKDIEKNDPFTQCNKGPLRTAQRRNTFYKKNFPYTKPVEVFLGYNAKNRPVTYHYIPIHKSVEKLYSCYPSHFKFYEDLNDTGPPERLSDVFHGTVFRKNALFSKEKSFYIILYQDAFEVVNPLGSAKKKKNINWLVYTTHLPTLILKKDLILITCN